MSSHRSLRTLNAVTAYLLVFSMLASPASPRSGVSAAALASQRANAPQQPAPASISFTKSDSLLVDQDGDGRVEAGDTLRYTLTAQNTGSLDAGGVSLNDILGANLSFVPASLHSTPLAFDGSLSVLEDSAPVPFVLQGADFDGDSITYTIVTQPVHGVIAGTPPNLTYQPAVNDYFGSDSLTFTVCDSAPTPNCDTAAVAFTIQPVNDAPTFSAADPDQTVLEDSVAFSLPGWAVAISAGPANESSQTLAFSVDNDNPTLFTAQPAVSQTGVLSFTPAANRYGQAHVSVTLTDDGGSADGGSDTSIVYTFAIDVLPVNDAPAFTAGPDVSAAEDAGLQTLAGWAVDITSGPDEAGQSISFQITGNTNPGLFAIGPSVAPDGTLTFTPASETSGTASISLRLLDDGGTANGGINTSATQSFEISVQDINDAPMVNGATFTLAENSPVGTLVGAVTYADADLGQTHAFSITAGNTSGAFAIDPSSGVIQVASPAALDYETQAAFTLSVTVTDDGSPAQSGSAAVVVNLTDANDAPLVSPAAFSLPENSANDTTVGSVTFTDQDSSQAHTFAMTGGNTGGAFAIDSTGKITVANSAALNYETTPSFSLTVTVTDNGAPVKSGSAVVTISLGDLNDAPSVSDAAFAVNEFSSAGTLVGTVTANDTDSGQSLAFAITAGNTSGAFAIDSSGKITVANSNALDVLITTIFVLTVQVTDNGSPVLQGTGTITITVTDLNDAPIVTGASFNVEENKPAGTPVGTVTYTDRDTGQGHAFAITAGNDGGHFVIDPASGEIKTVDGLNYESQNVYNLTVTVTDNGTPTAAGSAAVTVTVIDINEPPVAGPAAFTLPENSLGGVTVGTLSVSDPDAAQTHTFTIVSGNTGSAFGIDSTGKLTVAAPAALDFETNPVFTLQIKVEDSGSPTASVTAPVTVNLTNVNETPVIENAAFSINENLPNASIVGTVPVVDPDAGQTHVFALTAGNTSGAFAIDNTGKITVADTTQLNFEAVSVFTLQVQVTDNGVPVLNDTAQVTITLKDVNEAPNVVGESYQTVGNTLLQVAQTATAAAPRIFVSGSLISNDSDPDAGDAIHAALATASTNAVVNISADGSFTYLPPAGVASDSFTYNVIDKAGLSTTGTVTITLLGRVWYVKNNVAAGGLGRSADPFDTLLEAQTASSAGDTLYVYYGSGTTTGQNSGIILKNNQRLLGEAVALEMPVSVNGGTNPTALLAAGQKPLIGNGVSGGKGVTITNGSAEVRGLNINASGNAFEMSITTSGSYQLILSENVLTSGANGVWINRTSGTLTITGFANNQVTGGSGSTGVYINSVSFDAAPGGALDLLNMGSLTVSQSGGLTGKGLVITDVSGSIRFTSLAVSSSGTYALEVSGKNYDPSPFGVAVDNGHGSLTASAGAAISLTRVNVDAQNMALSSTGSAKEGATFTTVTGTFSTTSQSAITNSAGTAFLVNGTGGGTANITYNGTISHTAGRTVEISNRSGGSVTFNGSITGTNSLVTGVYLHDNTGGAITFAGGLVLSTGSNKAFYATNPSATLNAATITVTGSANTLTTTTGTALSVVNTTIAGSGLNFRSVSANGAVTGIELDNTGSGGGLTITGTATGTTRMPASGGTIQNTTSDGVRLNKASLISLTDLDLTNIATSASPGANCGPEIATGCVSAVDMNTVSNAAFTGLRITNTGEMGISGNAVNGLSIANTTITGAGNSNDEYALLLVNPAGSVQVLNSKLTTMVETGFRLYINTGSMNLTLKNTEISSNNAAFGEDGFQFKAAGTSIATIVVEGSTFSGIQRDGIDGLYQDTAQLKLTANSNTFQNNFGYGGIIVGGSGAAKGLLVFDNNTISNTANTAIVLGSANTAKMDATVTNNKISHAAPPAPQVGEGIRLSEQDSSEMTVLVSGNQISGVSYNGISGYAGALGVTGTTGSLHVTALNNTAGAPLTDPAYAVEFINQAVGQTLCLELSGNTATGKNYPGIRVRNASTGIFQLEKESGALGPISPADTAAYINSKNTSAAPAVATPSTTTFTGVAPASCRDAGSLFVATAGLAPSTLLAHAGGRGSGLARIDNPAVQSADGSVQVNIGLLPAGKSVTISFDAVLANPLPDGVYQVSNQAVLSGGNFADVLSDDPATPALGDPTITQLYRMPTAQDDLYTMDEDAVLVVPAPGVLSNDLASDGYTLTAVLVTGPSSGALSLAANGGLTYTTAPNVNGDQTFTYHASDGTSISDFTLVTLRVVPVNDAPVLDASGNMQMGSIGTGDLSNAGTLIRDLLNSAGDRISDVDTGAVEGLALTAADTAHGVWQYSTNDGLTWEDLGTPSPNAARLLANDSDTRLRFQPGAAFSGVIDPALTYRAWDRTTGVNGGTADVTTNGGITAFSTAQETASIEVYPLTDLALTKTASASTALSGSQLVYTLIVSNNGPSDAQSVLVTDPLPAAANLVSASAGCSEAGGVVTCTQGSLNAGASVAFSLTIRIATDFTGLLTNTAVVSSPAQDSDSANNTASAAVTVTGQVVVLDPTDPPDLNVWSNPITTQPACQSSFMGEYSNETVTLSLGQLPQHTQATIEFDLLIIRSWDGNQTSQDMTAETRERFKAMGLEVVGPDVWSLSADGQPLLNTTFSNWDAFGFHQAYPGPFPGGDYPARTGAVSTNSLCYDFNGYSQDTTYHMRYTIPHSANSLWVDFSASGLQAIADESWGLDNVSVTLSSGAELMPFRLYLPEVKK